MTLPRELLTDIFDRLSSADDLRACACVCRDWHEYGRLRAAFRDSCARGFTDWSVGWLVGRVMGTGRSIVDEEPQLWVKFVPRNARTLLDYAMPPVRIDYWAHLRHDWACAFELAVRRWLGTLVFAYVGLPGALQVLWSLSGTCC